MVKLPSARLMLNTVLTVLFWGALQPSSTVLPESFHLHWMRSKATRLSFSNSLCRSSN